MIAQTDKLFAEHSRSPMSPQLKGHELPRKACEGCKLGMPRDARGRHYDRNYIYAYTLQCRSLRRAFP